MSLEFAEVEVGTVVTTLRSVATTRVGGYGEHIVVPAATDLTVTRVGAHRLLCRGLLLRGGTEEASVHIHRVDLEFAPGGTVVGRNLDLRKLGHKPDDTEDMTYIPIDHPGIQWLFDDMGAYAEREGYCGQYDALCAKLGIPGRPREFNVHETVNGVKVSASIRARSTQEARDQLRAALGITPKTEPDFAPAA